jgi:hypothetical protein
MRFSDDRRILISTAAPAAPRLKFRREVSRRAILDGAWWPHSRRIEVAGRTVRIGWFTTLDAELLIATTGGDQRVDLLVVSPDAPSASAHAAMTMASGGPDALTAAAVREATSAQTPEPPTSQSLAEADWESEGGQVSAIGQ